MSVLGKTDKFFYTLFPSAAGKLSLPDFLGIGAPQSGSTWLYENIKKHSGIYMPTRKEIHYFDRKFKHPLKYYASFFDEGRGLLKGEITPGYSILSIEMIRFIKMIIPEVKIIYIIRNPVDQRLSAARRVFAKQSNNPFYELPEKEIFDFLSQQKDNEGNYAKGVRRFDHSKVLKNWWKIFPKEQMFIGFFEDIIEKPQQLMENIFQFLGVSIPDSWESFLLKNKINKNPAYEIPDKYLNFMKGCARKGNEELYMMLRNPIIKKWMN